MGSCTITSNQNDIPTQMKEMFTLGEYTFSKPKARKTLEPDEISNEIIINLALVNKTKLLEIFNHRDTSWIDTLIFAEKKKTR